MTPDEALDEMRVAAAYWSVGEWTNQDVIDIACQAVAGGLDTQGLRELAGVLRADVDWQVRVLLPVALDELGLEFFEQGSPDGELAALKVMARYCLKGTMTPRTLAAWAHYRFGHGKDPVIERIAVADDRFDIIEQSADSDERLDQEIIEACRMLLEGDQD